MRSILNLSLCVSAIAGYPALALASDLAQVMAPSLEAGDTWVFSEAQQKGVNGYTERKVEDRVERVDADSMVVGVKTSGAPGGYEDHIVGLDWSQRRLVDGALVVTTRPFSFPMKIGDTWTADYMFPQRPPLGVAHFHRVVKVMGWEDISTPAGPFRALKIESRGTADSPKSTPAESIGGVVANSAGATSFAHSQRPATEVVHISTYNADYYVPSIKYFVKSVSEEYNSSGVLTERGTSELVSFKPASGGSPRTSAGH